MPLDDVIGEIGSTVQRLRRSQTRRESQRSSQTSDTEMADALKYLNWDGMDQISEDVMDQAAPPPSAAPAPTTLAPATPAAMQGILNNIEISMDSPMSISSSKVSSPKTSVTTDMTTDLRRVTSKTPEEPVMQGYMTKKGDGMGFLSRWQNRYFVLGVLTHELAWYENEAAYRDGDKPHNTLHCSDIQRVEMPPREATRLNLVTISRVYQLDAGDPATARKWYDSIQRMSKLEDESLGQVKTVGEKGIQSHGVFHTEYKLRELVGSGKAAKTRTLTLDETDGVDCVRHTTRWSYPAKDILGVERDPENPLRFFLKVCTRHHFEAATAPQLNEIEMSAKVLTGELVKPKGVVLARPKKKVQLSDFEIVQRIGDGAQGAVALVRHRKTAHLFAMKMFKLNAMSKEALEQTKREKDVLAHVRHPFLVQLFYGFVQENKIFLVLELANGGELFVHLQRQPARRFPFPVAAFYMAEVITIKHDLDPVHPNPNPHVSR